MAGQQRTEPYPQPYGPSNPGPMIPGFTAAQSAAYNNPAPPTGYNTWTDYVLDVLNASDAYRPGFPETSRLGIGTDDDPLYNLTNNMGYGRLAPLVDTSNPRIQQFLDNTYYSNTSYDTFSPFGDQFFTALMGLGLATGGAAAFGGFAAPAAGAGVGASAGAAGSGSAAAAGAADVIAPVTAGAGSAITATPTTLAPAAGGLLSSLGAASPYISGASTGLKTLGSLSGNKELSTAGTALGYAGTAAGAAGGGGSIMAGDGGFGDWAALITAASAAAGVAGSAISAGAAGDAADAQVKASALANATQLQMFEQTRADLAPYRAAGLGALWPLADLAQRPLTVDPYSPTPVFDPTPAYTGPSEADLRANPGYQFRVAEGQKALERSAAGKGLLLSGGQLKDLTRFGQEMGAQEYAAAYARGYQKNQDVYARGYAQNADLYGRNLEAYQTRYNTLLGLRKNQFGELAGVAGAGQGAVNTLGEIGQKTGDQLAQTTIGAGNAQAAGAVGAANAWNAGLGSIGKAGNQYLNYQLLSQYLNRNQGDGSWPVVG